jgi:phosphoesterase RecJ-like protein
MQNQILGRCLMESILVLHGKVVVAALNRKMIEFYGASPSDLDGIIDQLRVTKGTEVAVFVYETDFNEFKVSMRSNGEVNVSKIAVYFGGGGHIKAAGCTMNGSVYDVINNLTPHIEAQLDELNLLSD